MQEAKAYSPANLSCVFRVIENKNPRKKHSLGMGFTVDKGVVVSVEKSKNNIILFNNKKIRFPTVTTVIKKLTNQTVKVKINSELPLGAGFGLSGASALATAYALNKLLKLNKSKKELAMIAHTAEVINSTGLGDVGGQFNGGFMVKLIRGNPLKVKRLPVKEKYIYYKAFSKLSTKSVITNSLMKKKINKAGDITLKKIKKLKKPTLQYLIKISKEFAVSSGLLKSKKVISLIKKIENAGGNASMIMLGNAVFSNIPFKGSKKLRIVKKSAYLLEK